LQKCILLFGDVRVKNAAIDAMPGGACYSIKQRHIAFDASHHGCNECMMQAFRSGNFHPGAVM
jgi:hypothetical protein